MLSANNYGRVQIKHLKRSRWRFSQLEMVRYLAAAGANRYWEHVLYEPMLAGQHTASARAASDKQQQLHTKTKKPNPNDPVHPTKAEFIREKYLFLGFFKRPRNISQEDLNHQLHASVRTGVLETSLYLLALGANPNFVHPTKDNSPIHVACQYGQLGQVEVLLAYGADVCVRDMQGRTPVDIALERSLAAAEAVGSLPTGPISSEQKLRIAWSPLVDTLVNAYYEVTDALAYFLARRVPDHKEAVLGPNISMSPALPTRKDSLKPDSRPNGTSQISFPSSHTMTSGHFLISTPLLHTLNGSSNGSSEDWIFEARRRLSQLPNMAFEDLCVDVYDEADRRLTNSFLENSDTSATDQRQNHSSDSSISGAHDHRKPVPPPHKHTALTVANRSLTLYFLPPNTAYSSVRNQARQKLGRLSTVEFHTLVLDILTEVSTRLLPLFPPVRSLRDHASRPDVSSHQHHPYQAYLAPAMLTEDIPTSVPPRSVPLPSPPLAEPGLECEVDTPSPIEPITCMTNPSSCLSDCNRNSQIEADRPPCSVNKPQQNGIRTSRTRSDDPVYDQVAADSDVQASLTPTSPSIPHSPSPLSSNSITNGCVVRSSSERSTGPSTSMVLCDSNEINGTVPLTDPLSTSSSAHRTQTGAEITSQPGPSPGSRRLHLSHTSRHTQHRASVPSAQTSLPKSIDLSLSPILEAANLATNVPLAHLSPTTSPKPSTGSPTFVPSTSTATPSTESPQKSAIEPCCVAAKNEIDRLRRENVDLRSQMSGLEIAKQTIENRMKSLEVQVQKMSQVVESLREEKSALLAAFSAGMVMTHSPPNLHKAIPTSALVEVPTSQVVSTQEAQGSASSNGITSTTETDETKKAVAEYEEENDDYGDRSLEAGNYSVGSECLDSGVLLRQGIIMRSGGSRGGSPASSVPASESVSILPTSSSHEIAHVIRPGEAGQHETSPVWHASQSTPMSGCTTYVNVNSVPPRLLPKPVVGGVRVLPASFTSPTTPVVLKNDDYIAPNSTGSASPAPVRSTSDHSNQFTPVQVGVGTAGPRLLQQRKQELQKQHAQILASIAALPEYDAPADTSAPSSPVVTVESMDQPYKSAISSPSGGPPDYASGQGPTSDRVVRCVETIIVRIRNLVQLANGERTGDFVSCSLLIQSAVQDILSIFPSLHQCPPRVVSALSDLSSVSRQLRPHCELMSRKLHASPLAQRQGNAVPHTLAPEVNVLIRHAHQIAKAAKELLSIFQRPA
ncbi:ARF GTPase-activating protein GIT2 [Clonorchis sinensis]|uniref:ARF GTPase-activating protein GIT2 n=1 Tax=Clonorchis sinensis TaxID=79923 RepID=G7YNF2_CLOSI|nr:ARF GTPase-activating protein GIT2 [Clonorchis sinensis]